MKEKVKALCKQQGKSLKDLARDLGIKPESLTRTLNEEKGNPTLRTLQKIAESLNVEVWELFVDPESVGPGKDIHGVIWVEGKPCIINSLQDLENLLQQSQAGKS